MHPYIAQMMAEQHLDALRESAERSRRARELRRRRHEAARTSPMGCAS